MKEISLAEYVSWDSKWKNLKVVVAGIGVSGFAVADTLLELQAEVIVIDSAVNAENEAKADVLKILGAEVFLGEKAVTDLPKFAGVLPDLVVVSPGWFPDHKILLAACKENIPIWSEVELAWRLRVRAGCKVVPWLVVTGTNGKTSTVKLLESVLGASGLKALAVGNVGKSVLDALREPVVYDVFVVELSSFQLHWVECLSAWSSVCLNIAADHLDWHGSFENYYLDKSKIYEHTQKFCIYNVSDLGTKKMVLEADVLEGARAVGFTTGVPEVGMIGIVDGVLCDRAFLKQRQTTAIELISVVEVVDKLGAGLHVLENFLAVAALARSFGVEPSFLRLGLKNFVPEQHRNEIVIESKSVLWVNDSKATNAHAARASLLQYERIVWIVGGVTKGIDYVSLFDEVLVHVKAIIIIGREKKVLRELFSSVEDVLVYEVADNSGFAVMEEAVRLALKISVPGDCVLLAPAAASTDQFSSYVQRGVFYKQAVLEIVTNE